MLCFCVHVFMHTASSKKSPEYTSSFAMVREVTKDIDAIALKLKYCTQKSNEFSQYLWMICSNNAYVTCFVLSMKKNYKNKA